jgi:hypothetical protein
MAQVVGCLPNKPSKLRPWVQAPVLKKKKKRLKNRDVLWSRLQICFFCGTGVWTQVIALVRQVSSIWAIPLAILWIPAPAPIGLEGFPFASRHSVSWVTCLVHFTMVILEIGESQELFAQAGLLISASQVARITGMSPWYTANIVVLCVCVSVYVVLGFELKAYTLNHSTNPYLWWAFLT